LIENSEMMSSFATAAISFFLNVTKSAGVYGRVSCAYAIRCGYPHNTREACFAFGCRNSYN